MIDNNVTVLSLAEIAPILKYIKMVYGNKCLVSFKVDLTHKIDQKENVNDKN